MNTWEAVEGRLDPPGASWDEEAGSWNFTLYSRNASTVTLLLYAAGDTVRPLREVPLDPFLNRSGPVWHCRVPGGEAGEACYYAWRVSGPAGGFHAFDSRKVLLDPYARAVHFPDAFDRDAARIPGPNDGRAPLGILEARDDYDWEGDRTLKHGPDLVIYEMHVRGFTRHPSSGVPGERRGTFAGLVDKIPYLQDLGVTAVELMPVFQFDPQEGNYWGYMPLNFFAPHGGYAVHPEAFRQRDEFRDMVKALHRAGIEVILDVVYNHTCEGDERGPTYCYKGIDNRLYYLSSGWPDHPYANFSGTGNTLDASDPVVRKLIVDSLRYWREEMHVDGFRFDLASIFTRMRDGSVDSKHPPIFGQIASSQGFADVRLIAEPWDAGGAYQIGRAFPGWLWMQWNGMYRDTLQRFVRGDAGQVPDLMTRLYGSSDLFPDGPPFACRPWQSVNYITSHDGSTLADLVTCERKYNWANGEDNRDGPHEFKWNCGWEGEGGAPERVTDLRKRQVRNFFCLLMLSNGSPMFRMGDEFLQTQRGNNNAWNQDNETSWLDWGRLEAHGDIHRFVRAMIAFRKAHPAIVRSHFWREDVRWHGTGDEVDLSKTSRHLAYHLRAPTGSGEDLYVMINAGRAPLLFEIQAGGSPPWRRAIDTSYPAPQDILGPGEEVEVESVHYTVAAHSVVVLTR